MWGSIIARFRGSRHHIRRRALRLLADSGNPGHKSRRTRSGEASWRDLGAARQLHQDEYVAITKEEFTALSGDTHDLSFEDEEEER